jgi:hypothetical protein
VKTIFDKAKLLDRLSMSKVEEYIRFNEERLAAHVMSVPTAWHDRHLEQFCYPGECFGRAVQFLRLRRKLPQAEFVFGEALLGGLHRHGWVEIDGIVFDGVLQEFYSRDGYYKAQCVKPWYRYDRQATLYMDNMSKRYADSTYEWHFLLSLPWSKYVNLPVYTLDDVRRLWHSEEARKRRKRRAL